MSNRVRILFHCALEGQAGHVGNRALRAMEVLCQNAHTLPVTVEEWVNQDEWTRLGRPAYIKKGLKVGPFGNERHYLLGSPAKPAPIEVPKIFLSNLTKAKWLWEHLPTQIRAHCHLKVLREPRNSRWKASKANPVHWGWNKAPAVAPNTPTAKPEMVGFYVKPSIWDLHTSDRTVPVPGSPESDALMLEKLKARVMGKAQKAKQKSSPYLKFVPKEGLPEPSFSGDGEFVVSEQSGRPKAAKASDVKAKKRLQLGIWS